MPIELQIYERRDNTNLEDLGNAALNVCRAWRATEGIRSARFYWYAVNTVIFWIEGEAQGLNATADANMARAVFDFADLARRTMAMRLSEPRVGEEAYHLAGR